MSTFQGSLRAGVAAFAIGVVFAAPPALAQGSITLPSASLEDSLNALSRQSGAQILVDQTLLRGKKAQTIRGASSVEAALAQLLRGSRLTYQKRGDAFLIIHGASGRTPRGAGRRASPDTRDAGAESPNDGAGQSRLDEIIVTAQKRDEDVQNVSISITSLSARTIENFRITSMEDVSRLTPGLLVSQITPGNPVIAIRGANNTFSQVGVNKPVGVVVDDVFIPRNSGATFELFDIASVQVLKGPQGTLFGRNVSGGVVVINTRDPSFDKLSGGGLIEAGNYSSRRADVFVNTPLSEKVAVSASGSIRDRDGYSYDRLTGREQDDQHSQNLRGKVRLALTPTLDAIFSADYAHDWNNGRTFSSKNLGDDGNRRTSEMGYPQSYNRTIWGTSARLTWSPPVGEITSITAYRSSNGLDVASTRGTSYIYLDTGTQSVSQNRDKSGAFSQELRYASPNWKIGNFIAGLYFLDQIDRSNNASQGLAAQTGIIASSTRSLARAHTRSYAVFLDGTFHLTNTVDLTAGIRYTRDEKTAERTGINYLNPAAGITLPEASGSWNKATPRVVLTWRPAPALNLYGSISQGFTSGGFNADSNNVAELRTSFRPETLTNYEAGIKSEWFDRRLRVNAAIFHMKYKDKQERVQNVELNITSIFNAADAVINGYEVEAQFIPFRGVTLGANYGNLRTRYKDFLFDSNVDYTGNLLGSAPKNKYALYADMDIPLGEHGFLLGTASYSFTGRYNTGATNDPNLYVPAYGLTNFSLGYATPDHRWRITGWVKNASDIDYLYTHSSQPPVLAEYLGAPRTYGLSVSTRF